VAQENSEELGRQKMALVLRALNNLYMSTYKGVIDQAFQDLRAVNADQTQPMALMCDSLSLARQGKLDEAKEVYGRALRRAERGFSPTDLLGLRLIHGEFLRLLKNRLALEDFLEVDRLKPDNPFILSRIALSYASARDFTRAREFLSRTIGQCDAKGITVPLIKDSAQRTLENVEASLRGEVPPHARYRSSSASSGGSAGSAQKSAGGGVAAPPAQPQVLIGVNEKLDPVRRSIKSLRWTLDVDASETTPRHHVGTPHPQLPPRHGAAPSVFGGAAAPSITSPRHLPPRHSPAAKTREAEAAPAQLPKEVTVVSSKPTAEVSAAGGKPAPAPKEILPKPSPMSPPRAAIAPAQQEMPTEGTGVSFQERLKAFSGQAPKVASPAGTSVKNPVSAPAGMASAEAGRAAPAAPKSSPTGTSSPSAALLAKQNLSPQNRALAGTAASNLPQGQAPVQATALAQNRLRGGSAGMAQLLRQQAAARSQDQSPAPGK
jgi:hypothetical protein